jgi:hypothetical protein
MVKTLVRVRGSGDANAELDVRLCLKAVSGSDDGAPCITVMDPEED